MTKEIKLSKKQKEVIRRMKVDGDFIWENVITPGAKWCIGKRFDKWGNVNGRVMNGIMHLLAKEKINISVYRYSLNQEGVDMPCPS